MSAPAVPGGHHLGGGERARHDGHAVAPAASRSWRGSGPGSPRSGRPARMQARAVSGSSTVPAPTSDVGAEAAAPPAPITPTAPGTVIVISSTVTPPVADGVDRLASASSADCARTTGTRPTSRDACRGRPACSWLIASALPPARAAALHHALHLGQGRHGGVAGRGHGQRAVGGAALDRPLRRPCRRGSRRCRPEAKESPPPTRSQDLEVLAASAAW